MSVPADALLLLAFWIGVLTFGLSLVFLVGGLCICFVPGFKGFLLVNGDLLLQWCSALVVSSF